MDTQIFKKFSSLSVAKAIPLQASLELTYRCNERCTHCYIESFHDDPKRLLDLEQWFVVLEKLRAAGTLYLVLMGGEPTLSPHFFEVSKRAAELGFYVSMISNGLKIQNREFVEKMKNSGMKVITFSLYSLVAEIHDQMTQVKGSQQRVLKAIDLCLEQGLQVSVNCLLTEANSRGVFDLFEWAIERGLQMKVDPNITAKLNGDKTPTFFRASEETLLWFYRERSRRWKRSTPAPSLDTESSYICNAAKGKCAVTPYGELLPCIEIRESFGNLATDDFKTIWNSETALKWRMPKVKDLQDPIDHGDYGFCEHCPGMAKNEHQNPLRLTDYTKLIGRVRKQVYEELSTP